MGTVRVDEHAVTVTLSSVERIFCGGRSELVVPLAEVRAAERVDRPTRASVTGVGRAGLVVTGFVKLGRWGIGTPTHRFLSVRRWAPALRLVVSDAFQRQLGYRELLVSTSEVDRITEVLSRSRRRAAAAGSAEGG